MAKSQNPLSSFIVRLSRTRITITNTTIISNAMKFNISMLRSSKSQCITTVTDDTSTYKYQTTKQTDPACCALLISTGATWNNYCVAHVKLIMTDNYQ